MKTSSGKIVATSFLYLTVHRWIAGDIPIYLKFMRFPSTHRWTLYVTPKGLSRPKGGSKREFLHLALPFLSSLQVTIDTLNMVCGLNIASPSLQMTNRPWNWRGHVTWPILYFSLPKISLERLKLKTLNLVCMLIIASPQIVPERGVVRSCDPLKFWGSNHITKTAEPKVVKFRTQVGLGYINSSNRMTYQYLQQKGRGYGHVTVLKFCRRAVCQRQLSYL